MNQVIKRKNDINEMLKAFDSIADYDEHGQKYYFVFQDKKRGGQWTLMKTGNKWSIHGKGKDYCDAEEIFLTSEEVVRFIWKNRSAVNQKRKMLYKKEPVRT
ncbi:hypothetical protein [Alteribacillus bidgolensis]|uniref:Uncharacterized protein n=1 Tax=Alteribacillus bidgolensis TaxID=930129 RepID=A0A1G8IS32_9BACI|nr:hypothetical protein [Alteribacillus bidgolensis]SDI21651.1 hypothetical protein SAMN05216352_105316 [Alteribacillus bidgolensis]